MNKLLTWLTSLQEGVSFSLVLRAGWYNASKKLMTLSRCVDLKIISAIILFLVTVINSDIQT